MVTEPIVWLLTRPLEVNAVDPAPYVLVCPYVLLSLFAVTVSDALLTVSVPAT